jgi:hypothetical protein
MSLRCTIIGVGISSFLSIIQFIVENAWECLENGGQVDPVLMETCVLFQATATVLMFEAGEMCVQNPVPGTNKEISVNRGAVIF